MTKKELSDQIRAIRKANIPASDLAIKTGLREAQISKIENGRENYTIDKFLRYCEGSGIEIIVKPISE